MKTNTCEALPANDLDLVAERYAVAITPVMQELKAAGLVPGSDEAAQFGRLHGISSILYLITSLLGLYVVLTSSKGHPKKG